MSKLKIGINGFGRIGRIFFRQAFGHANIEIVAIASRSDLATYAHLLKYDSAYGTWQKDVKVIDGKFVVDGATIPFLQSTEPTENMWGALGVDLVVEASGKLKKMEQAQTHLDAGAKYVLLTSPGDGVDGTFVYGINHNAFDTAKHHVISAASCTTTCTSLVVKVLEAEFGIAKGFINTIHAFTQDQNLHDASHKDLRRARSAIESIIPTSSGVTKALGELFPQLKGKFSGQAFRVPVIVPSIITATFELKKNVTAEEVNAAFVKATEGELKGALGASDLPLVSKDYQGSPTGGTVDLLLTEVVDGNMLSVSAWYDNEWGYVANVVRLLESISGKLA